MKNFFKIFTIFCLFLSSAQAQESASSNQQINTLREINNQIVNIETNIQTLQNYVDAVVACGDNTPPQHYNGTTCVTIVERDPLIETHGTQSLSGSSCGATNEAQQFQGGTWTCKTLN